MGEIFLCLISINSPTCFARRGIKRVRLFNKWKYNNLFLPSLGSGRVIKSQAENLCPGPQKNIFGMAAIPFLLCISTSFWVLRAPKSWSNYFFSAVFNVFVHIFKKLIFTISNGCLGVKRSSEIRSKHTIEM